MLLPGMYLVPRAVGVGEEEDPEEEPATHWHSVAVFGQVCTSGFVHAARLAMSLSDCAQGATASIVACQCAYTVLSGFLLTAASWE